MQGQRIGYVRVSSFDRNPNRQLEQTEVGGVFTDVTTPTAKKPSVKKT